MNNELFFSIAYHPQTDGQSEHSNRIAEIALRHWVATHRGQDEDDKLPLFQMSLNAGVKASTGYTPHMLLYGIEL